MKNLKREPKKRERTITLPARFTPKFWADTDARVAIVRTIKKRYRALRDDCGGGESAQRDLLIQRLAFLSVLIESQEVTAAEAGTLDCGGFVQALNSMVGLVRILGLEKRIKSVRDLKAYLEEKAA